MMPSNHQQQDEQELQAWLAELTDQMEHSALVPMRVDGEKEFSKFLAGDGERIEGRLLHNQPGLPDTLDAVIRQAGAGRWKVTASEIPADWEILGLVLADFSFADFPTLEQTHQLPDLARAIRVRRQRNPEAGRKVAPQLAAAGELRERDQLLDHPCGIQMDPRTLKYRVRSSLAPYWIVVELECLAQNGKRHVQRRVHQLAWADVDNEAQSETVQYSAEGRFDMEILKDVAESDRVTLRIRSLGFEDSARWTFEEKNLFLADRGEEMQALPAVEQTDDGFVCRVSEAEKDQFSRNRDAKVYLHISKRPAAGRRTEEENTSGKKPAPLTKDQQLAWEGVFQREYAHLRNIALACTRNPEKALDLVQEVFARFMTKHADVKSLEDELLRNQLARGVRNLNIDTHRLKRSHEAQFAVDEDGVSAETQIENAKHDAVPAPDLAKVIASLIDRQEEVYRQQLPKLPGDEIQSAQVRADDLELILLRLLGHTRPEIATILGLTPGQYDSAFRRVRQQLKKEFSNIDDFVR